MVCLGQHTLSIGLVAQVRQALDWWCVQFQLALQVEEAVRRAGVTSGTRGLVVEWCCRVVHVAV